MHPFNVTRFYCVATATRSTKFNPVIEAVHTPTGFKLYHFCPTILPRLHMSLLSAFIPMPFLGCFQHKQLYRFIRFINTLPESSIVPIDGHVHPSPIAAEPDASQSMNARSLTEITIC